MDRRTRNATKEHASGSISLSEEILDRQPAWSRCNSFSSSSNDSAVFCSNRHLKNSGFSLGKRLPNEGHTANLNKRNRNSSGSSVSSNLSCISDKDTKKTSVIISTSIPQISSNGGVRSKVEELSRLSCPEINSTSFELQHKTLLNERLSCPQSSNSVLPFRHNLRRNIRKKTCSCDCTATCTTLVVRRYKEIGKETVEEQTVISRTKVQTCTQNSTADEVHKVSFKESYSPSSKSENNRKRRSEVEKLYDSLHEIEWAKNFSPDNILRQINIRQAASCSIFGQRPSSNDKSNSADAKPSKRQKVNQRTEVTNSTISRTLPENTKSEFNSTHFTRSSASKNRLITTDGTSSRDITAKNRISRGKVKQNMTNLQQSHEIDENSNESSAISTSSMDTVVQNHKEKNCNESSVSNLLILNHSKDDNSSESISIDIPNRLIQNQKKDEISVESSVKNRINFPNFSTNCELKPNCTKSTATCDKSLINQNHFKQSQSPTLVESSLIPKNYLFNIKNEPEVRFDIPELTAEYSVIPTFFDIAEEGIRTIDACFREVGAEVVISTCYEDNRDLPLLTSVKDNNLLDKISSVNENPPVLEPCVSVQDQSNTKIEYDLVRDPVCSTNDLHEKSLNSTVNHCENILVNSSIESGCASKTDCPQTLTKLCFKADNLCVNNSLIKNAGKRILNKYLKFLRSRTKSAWIEEAKKLKEKYPEAKKDSSVVSINRTASSLKENPFLEDSLTSKITTLVPASSEPQLNCQTSEQNTSSKTVVKISNQKVLLSRSPEKITLSHSKSSSCVYTSDKEQPNCHLTTTKSVTNKSLVVKETFQMQHTAVVTTHVPRKPEPGNNSLSGKVVENIPRPKSFTFSCHYQTIRVNRNNGYTQVILRLTNGTSSYLSIESLTELKEIVNRTGQDANCHTLILNGIGDSFCLGLDLRPLLGPEKVKASKEIAVAVKEFVEALSDFKKPFVAVVNGPAYGLGMTILNHADITIASDSATFCMPQSSLGYFPEGGATLTLPQAVGSTVAMDLILRGRVVTAIEAKNIGLISEVVEEKKLPHDLISRVKILAGNSLSSMETAKAMLKMRLHLELLMVLENEVKLLPQMWLSSSCQDALLNATQTGGLLANQ